MKKLVIGIIAALAFAGAANASQPVMDDVVALQLNGFSPQTATIEVLNNGRSQISSVDLEATAVGNNISVDGSYDNVVAVQGNGFSSQTATVTISGNVIRTLEIDATAVGNNLSVDLDVKEANNGCLTGTCGHDNHVVALQGNLVSGQTATIDVSGNIFGNYDPELNATAVGNNISGTGIIGSLSGQINLASPQVASVSFVRNVGLTRPLNINATAVGNNLSVSTGGLGI